MNATTDSAQHTAVVVGLCPHGLAIVRELCAKGLHVIALESNPTLPGTKTRYANLQLVDDINGERLIDNLLALARSLNQQRPALYLTNDRMVAIVGKHMARLKDVYQVAWEANADAVLQLIAKRNIEAHCEAVGLRYPKSQLIEHTQELLAQIEGSLRYPIIVKPSTPLAGFKTLVFHNSEDLAEKRDFLSGFTPLIAQEFIEGPEENTRFAALVLNQGEVLARFEGRKLRSRPLGHTTAAIPFPDDRLHAAALRFLAPLKYSGTASLEMKIDPSGEYWVIEPTLGRTDFWADLCFANHPDFLCVTESPRGSESSAPESPWIWFNSERDKGALFWVMRHWPSVWRQHRARMAYLNQRDMAPFLYASLSFVRSLVARAVSRVAKLVSSRRHISALAAGVRQLVVYRTMAEFDDGAHAILAPGSHNAFFCDVSWYRAFTREILTASQGQVWLALQDDGCTVALLPMMQTRRGPLKILRAMSNYYTPYFHVLTLETDTQRRQALTAELLQQAITVFARYDTVELSPVLEDFKAQVAAHCPAQHFHWHVFEKSGNWRLTGATNYEAFLRERPAKVRRTLARKQKKIASHQTATQLLPGPELERDLQDYHRVYAGSWKVNEPYPAFIDEVVRAAATRGEVRLAKLCIDGQVAASQIWFVQRGVAYIFKLAYDEAFAHFSPGTVLTFQLFQRVLDMDGVHTVDYLTGNDAYKADLMNERRPLYGIEISNRHRPGGLLLALKNQMSLRAKSARRVS